MQKHYGKWHLIIGHETALNCAHISSWMIHCILANGMQKRYGKWHLIVGHETALNCAHISSWMIHPCNSNLVLGYKGVVICVWFRFGPGYILYTNSECFWVGERSEWQEDRHSSLTFVVSCLGWGLFEDWSASFCCKLKKDYQISLKSGGILCLFQPSVV